MSAGATKPASPVFTGVIPDETRRAAEKLTRKLGDQRSWWWVETIPQSGIPVVFAERGTYVAGTRGWIINGHGRTVYPGEQPVPTEVGEFIVLTESGTQCTAQVGRDIVFPRQPMDRTSKKGRNSGNHLATPQREAERRLQPVQQIEIAADPVMKDPTIEEMRAHLTEKYARLAEPSDLAASVEVAIYWFAAQWHGGQWSNLYSAMCATGYRPGPIRRFENEGELEQELVGELERFTGAVKGTERQGVA